jgi:hypothetical protein
MQQQNARSALAFLQRSYSIQNSRGNVIAGYRGRPHTGRNPEARSILDGAIDAKWSVLFFFVI